MTAVSHWLSALSLQDLLEHWAVQGVGAAGSGSQPHPTLKWYLSRAWTTSEMSADSGQVTGEQN